ncbi:hypothetical protein DDB_G0284479 [Dictyostelium discoideum AX4]|uniref:SRCR domain-containing protein n=1 Tax=Dictyostelium discoideum TaxID=44689 RepID=Q54PL6_DICDI|nr:hypothetical protein DDB_G0284479 [Dictyostelium discoideum AX4]EAL65166.1 hypothetical protein DDB_G0284479 [Dictyostelium discoideum AX4]|eukprot:XP_638516.1 hypothetical protein DDB_G0284479 [Dictyostelium discoideum AX4]
MKSISIVSLLILYCIISCGNVVVNAINGQVTYYNDQGYGSCGTLIDANTQFLAAVPPGFWTTTNPNLDPVCGKQVKLTYNGNSITLPVRDKCPGCPNNNIDISAPAFIQLIGSLGPGRVSVTWEFVGSSSSGGSTTGTVSTTNGNSGTCPRKASVSVGQGCYDVWVSKCNNAWDENQLYAANPGVSCTSLQVGQQLCCGGSTTGGSVTCSRKASVSAGQGCYDVWVSKCNNAWNENQFFAANPGVFCTDLQVGQQLCCN